MSFAAPLKNVNQMANGEMAQYGDDRKTLVSFTREPKLMGFESEKAGKPVYQDCDYINIVVSPGKAESKRVVKLEDDQHGPSDPHRWPAQWAAFMGQQHQVSDGLPIENWPPIGMSPAAIKGFKAADIHTVEILSGLSDANIGSIPVMDAKKWRDLAIKYIEQAQGGAPIAALTAENATLRQDMDVMRQQIEVLAANQKKTPGRKPGTTDEGE